VATATRARVLDDARVEGLPIVLTRVDVLLIRIWPVIRWVTEHPLAVAAETGSVFLGSIPIALLALFAPEQWRLANALVAVGGPSEPAQWSVIAVILAVGLTCSRMLDSQAGRLLFLVGHVGFFAALASAFALIDRPSLGTLVYGAGTLVAIAGVARLAREAHSGGRHAGPHPRP